MRYVVTERFYNSLIGLIGIAIEDDSSIEYDLAVGLINDTVTNEDA